MNGLGTGTVNAPKVDITNAKVGANSTDAAINAFAVADSRVRNDVADVENALAIDVIGDYLKRARRIGTWKFSKLGDVEVEKIGSWAVMEIIIPIYKSWNC